MKCKFCSSQLFGNPTVLKKHIASKNCMPPADVRYKTLKRLTENKRKNPRDDCPYQCALNAMDVAWHVSTDAPAAKRQAAPASGTCTGSSIVSFINRLTTDEVKAIDTKCARWNYRWALPLSTTEWPDFINFSKALNATYNPPSRYSMAGTLLTREFYIQQRMMVCFVRRCVNEGDVVIGGDLWGDRLNNSICTVMIFTPDPLYVETKVWGEARNSAENTASSSPTASSHWARATWWPS